MSLGDLFVPFNHQPVTTGTSSNYTVPAGKYARATVNLSVSAYPTTISSNVTIAQTHSENDGCVAHYWLKAGDVITCTNSTASASESSGTGFKAVASNSTASASINSNLVCAVRANSFVIGSDSNTSGATDIIIGGSSSAYIYYEEYNVLT